MLLHLQPGQTHTCAGADNSGFSITNSSKNLETILTLRIMTMPATAPQLFPPCNGGQGYTVGGVDDPVLLQLSRPYATFGNNHDDANPHPDGFEPVRHPQVVEPPPVTEPIPTDCFVVYYKPSCVNIKVPNYRCDMNATWGNDQGPIPEVEAITLETSRQSRIHHPVTRCGISMDASMEIIIQPNAT